MKNEKVLSIIEKSKQNHNTKNGLFLEKYIKYYNMPVQDNIVLYESFCGQGIIDNPYALFKSFMKRDDFKDYIHVWVLDDYESKWYQIIEYSHYANIRYVLHGSDEYLKYLSVAKYLINNCTFPSYFTKKDEQIYINTWHGKPIKKLGYDVPDSRLSLGNTVRNFLSADYLLSADPHMTDVYKHGYMMDGLYKGTIIEEGNPRCDLSYTDKDYVYKKLEAYGIKIEKNKKIILYAPTWSGTLSNPNFIDYESIEKIIDSSKYQLLIKTHHVNYSKKHQYIPVAIDSNELIAVCDCLITDYSSIAFDFENVGKPVIHYMPDYDKYVKEHGLYFEWKSNISYNLQTLKVLLDHMDKMKIEWHPTSECSDHILSIILDSAQGNTIKCDNSKIKLLFYVGDFKPNGVTSSFMSLAETIDYSKFDLSLIALNKKDELYSRFINRINPNVRVLCRSGTYAQTLLEESAKDITLTLGIGTNYLYNLLPKEMYKREIQRCFGGCKFDKLINFTGYSPFYSYLFMCMEGEKIVWQHNDMIADMNRESNGTKPLYNTLSVVFTTYPYYDKIVSASKEIMYVNMKSFPEIPENKFYYAHNTLDYNRIIKLSNEPTIQVQKDKINFVNNGRLSFAKNQTALIKAFNIFSKEHPNCELYIIGDGELKDQLINIANEHVHLVGYLENPYSLMKQCDYFIFPSLYEGQGISLLEARVLGLPIVISDLPKMRGIFYRHGQYNIRGFGEKEILDGLEACYHKRVKRFKFNPKKYNDDSYREFENVIMKEVEINV